jgi:hypothetical protein
MDGSYQGWLNTFSSNGNMCLEWTQARTFYGGFGITTNTALSFTIEKVGNFIPGQVSGYPDTMLGQMLIKLKKNGNPLCVRQVIGPLYELDTVNAYIFSSNTDLTPRSSGDCNLYLD